MGSEVGMHIESLPVKNLTGFAAGFLALIFAA
jgi:hypothetical protein